jgi:hypothetical protein
MVKIPQLNFLNQLLGIIQTAGKMAILLTAHIMVKILQLNFLNQLLGIIQKAGKMTILITSFLKLGSVIFTTSPLRLGLLN